VRKKNLYRCTSTLTSLNYCMWNFRQISQLSILSRAQKIFLRFLDFFKLKTAISRTLCGCSAPKRAFPSEKKLKTASKSAYKQQRNACSNYAPLERTARRPLSVTKNKHTYEHYIFAPTAGARCSISPKLYTVVELVVPIMRCCNHFSI